MLGYKGRSNRREFAAGAVLTVAGPMALSAAIKGSIETLFSTFPRTVALILSIALTVLVCAAVLAWFWGWSALLTRRARDIGLPAWAGVASAVILVALGRWIETVTADAVSSWIMFAISLVFVAVWSLWPGQNEGQTRSRNAPRPRKAQSPADDFARSSTVP